MKRIHFVAFCLAIASSAALSPAPPIAELPAQYWPSPIGLREQVSDAVSPQVPRRQDPRVVVVVYHSLGFGRPGGDYVRDLYNFEYDLAYLQRNFRIIDFGDLERIALVRGQPTTDMAIITFDDGDLSIYAIAYPLLKHYGIKATFFLISGMVGQVGYIGPGQVREMSDYRSPDGRRLFDFQSHTASHAFLSRLPADAAAKELSDSKASIEALTGKPVDVLALPFGDGAGNASLLESARKAGYKFVRTTKPKSSPFSALDPQDLGGFVVASTSSDSFSAMIEKAMER